MEGFRLNAPVPSVEFYKYESAYDDAVKALSPLSGPDPGWESYYSFVVRRLRGDPGLLLRLPSQETARLAILSAEVGWYRISQPTYRVYPAMVDVLLRTRIDIPLSFLKCPFDRFVVAFPVKLVGGGDDPYIKSVMVVCDDKAGFFFFRISREDAPDVVFHIARELIVHVGSDKVSDFVNMVNKSGVDSVSGLERQVIAIVLGVMFMATGRQRVKPDQRPFVEHERQSRHERRRREKELRRTGLDPKPEPLVFGVGRELIIPREGPAPGDAPSGDLEQPVGSGRRLSFSHMRTGHHRLLRHEDGTFDLVYVRPARIRPELPFREGSVRRYGAKAVDREIRDLGPMTNPAINAAAKAIRSASMTNPSRGPFITDMGESHELVADDGSVIQLGRYGVWKWDARKGKHQVAETGDDLAELQRRHGITEPPVRLK